MVGYQLFPLLFELFTVLRSIHDAFRVFTALNLSYATHIMPINPTEKTLQA